MPWPREEVTAAVPTQLPIQAIPYNTVPAPTTPWVNPGTYTVKLTVNGSSYTQPIVVKQDPRVKTPALAMQQVYTLTKAMYDMAVDARMAATRLGALRRQIAKTQPQSQGAVAQSLASFDKKAAALEGTPPQAGGGRGRGAGPGGGRGGPTPPAPPDTLWALSTALGGLMNSMQAADVAPTMNTLRAVTSAQQNAARNGEVGGASQRGDAGAQCAAQSRGAADADDRLIQDRCRGQDGRVSPGAAPPTGRCAPRAGPGEDWPAPPRPAGPRRRRPTRLDPPH